LITVAEYRIPRSLGASRGDGHLRDGAVLGLAT